MKILVDEMPRNSAACLFSEWSVGHGAFECRLIGFVVPMNCSKECPCLAKGVVSDELGCEDGRKAEDGKEMVSGAQKLVEM